MKTNHGSRQLVKLGAVLALLALVFSAALRLDTATTASAATTTVQVGQTNGGTTPSQEFNAASITVSAGDTIHWNWFDNFHNVAWAVLPAGAAPTNSSTGGPPLTFDQTLTVAGTYTYYCSLHAGAGDASLANVDSNIASHGKMVGKIVVSAPVTDTLAPTVSGVAAAPNPTLGAGAVVLTATVNDTAPAGATAQVAGAEWSKGVAAVAAGSGTAMAASDGAFNSASEGVTANVPIVEAAGTSVTLWVRGRDATGNWSAAAVSTVVSVTAPPAGSVQATVSVNAGSLTNTAQNVTFPAVTLDGTDQLKTGTTTAWVAKDARGSGAGWNVTISAGNFTSSSGSISVANFKCQLLPANISTVFGNTAPTTAIGTFVPLSGTPTKLLSAAASAGMGQYSYIPDFQLTVPGSTPAGSYTANISVSVNSGP